MRVHGPHVLLEEIALRLPVRQTISFDQVEGLPRLIIELDTLARH